MKVLIPFAVLAILFHFRQLVRREWERHRCVPQMLFYYGTLAACVFCYMWGGGQSAFRLLFAKLATDVRVLVPFAIVTSLICFLLSLRRGCVRHRRMVRALLGCMMLATFLFCLSWWVEEWRYKQCFVKVFSNCREARVYAEAEDPWLAGRSLRVTRVVRRETPGFSDVIFGLRNGNVQSTHTPRLFVAVYHVTGFPIALRGNEREEDVCLVFLARPHAAGVESGELLPFGLEPPKALLHRMWGSYMRLYPEDSFGMALLWP